MGFDPGAVDRLLAAVGRMCAICHLRHQVQVHHIIPRQEGGSDEIENAIPLCPNCHDAVHATYVPGRTTRQYTPSELREHLRLTIELASSLASAPIGARIDASMAANTELALPLPPPATAAHPTSGQLAARRIPGTPGRVLVTWSVPSPGCPPYSGSLHAVMIDADGFPVTAGPDTRRVIQVRGLTGSLIDTPWPPPPPGCTGCNTERYTLTMTDGGGRPVTFPLVSVVR